MQNHLNQFIQVAKQNYVNKITQNVLNHNHTKRKTFMLLWLKKVKRTIGLLLKFQQSLPRQSLITIYKSFILPHLDYGVAVYNQTFSESFHKNLECTQYNVAIAITRAMRGLPSEKLFQELRLKSLISTLWLRKLRLLYKIMSASWKISIVSFSANFTKQLPLWYK